MFRESFNQPIRVSVVSRVNHCQSVCLGVVSVIIWVASVAYWHSAGREVSGRCSFKFLLSSVSYVICLWSFYLE